MTMHDLPKEVVEYLSSDDSLGRAALSERNPQLDTVLHDPSTRKSLITWLGGDEPWEPESTEFTENTLGFILGFANAEDADIVRQFLLHSDPHIRLRASEYLLGLYFPDKNDDAMFLLLQNMIMDKDDMVRTMAVNYMERAKAIPKFEKFLRRWIKIAHTRGWKDTESFETVETVLKR